jgi:DNA-binding PadR family transcriptional regulator
MKNEISKDQITKIATLLYHKFIKDNKNKKLFKVKELLTFLISVGESCLYFPKTTSQALDLLNRFYEKQMGLHDKQYNLNYLKTCLKRLSQQKFIEIGEEENKQIVKITNEGKQKVLRLALNEVSPPTQAIWAKKWRIIVYDIPKNKQNLRNIVRDFSKRMEFYQLQKSVYLTPYPCDEEIEFFRLYYNLEEEIKVLTVSKLENDYLFRNYFGV